MHTSTTWTVRRGDDLGRAIAGVRAARSMTQAEVAELTGIDRTYLARLENGATVTQLERTLRILRRLGATVTIELDDGPGR
ncbi:MAG: helix-turn-helix transcriptional regulator [Actinobacteria bacterium]|nr:helix-turn-helix transcriptional regulator [Actinomycetota bacterium]